MLGLIAAVVFIGCTWAQALSETSTPRHIVTSAAQHVCSEGLGSATPVRGAELLGERILRGRGVRGLKQVWTLDGAQLSVTRLNRRGVRTTLFFVDYYEITSGTSRAVIRAVINDRCQIVGGREILYGPVEEKSDVALAIVPLGADLEPQKEHLPLNPELPPGQGHANCIRVGLLDNGVNYLLPEIASALARDAGGQVVGYDFWEEDRRPFDFGVPATDDPRISMFSPRRHGTAVASVFVREIDLDSACLAPYRYYPRDDDNKIDRIITQMAEDGVRIVSVSSGRVRPWPAFQEAMRRHPDMLFVLAAGNNGADLSERPFYPAAYDMENAIVVAASDDAGKLWHRSNRGEVVDLATNAVNVSGFDYSGSERRLTGTSFASPRVAALAARILSEDPELNAAQVKARILALAEDSGIKADGVPILTDEVLN